jgi:hypothetical protein
VPQHLHGLSITPMALITAVRDAVQRDIEPLPDGGVLSVTAVPTPDAGTDDVPEGAELRVRGGAGDAVVVAASPLGATV